MDDGSHDSSIPHACKRLSKRKQGKPGTGLVKPGKLVCWSAGLGRDHYDHPHVYDLVAPTGDEMMAKVAAHVGMDVAELERKFEEAVSG